MQRLATALLILLVVASVAPTAVGEPTRDSAALDRSAGQSYAGTHVSFDVGDRAVTDYAVGGETMLDSVRVESRERIESRDRVEDGGAVDADASLPAATDVEGAELNLSATTGTEARVAAETGATVTAHDNRRGVLVVASGDQSDYAVAALPAGASAETESDSEVAVTTENGTEATVFVVGEGTVAVDDEGDVTARLGADARLAVRSYPDGKDDADDERERLLAQGAASAEVYVTSERETRSERGNATENAGNASETENATESVNASERQRAVVDAVTYDANTSVDAVETAEGEVALAVNRTTHEGTVLLASVSGDLLDADEVTVTVDGEAAAEAVAYSQLESAVGSEQSRYVVETGAGANASTEVAVGVNHFSERTVAMTSPGAPDEGASDEGTSVGDEGTTDDEDTSVGETTVDEGATGDAGTTADESETGQGDGATTTRATDGNRDENEGAIPGFTPGVAVTALLVAVLALVASVVLARTR